ncbi:hypothetical protein H5T88_02675 [bacterium]|nr:hypothetical protein [bacterium]
MIFSYRITRRISNIRASLPRLSIIASIVLLLTSYSLAQKVLFAIPTGTKSIIWEAEKADRLGKWEVLADKKAHGGFYVRPQELNNSLLAFPFEVKQPTTLRIYPLWWRHGERKTVKRFPYPLPRYCGPDTLSIYGNYCFFTAPIVGKVGIIDMKSEKVIKVLDIGGYPVDIAVNENLGKVYIADAIGDRLVVLDGRSQRKIGEINLPKCPWSLTVKGNSLYVACKEEKMLVQIDMERDAITRQINLPLEPARVEIREGETAQLLVWGFPRIIETENLSFLTPYEEFFAPQSRKRVSAGENISYDASELHRIRVQKEGVTKWIDVKSITGESRVSPIPSLKPSPGPDALSFYKGLLYFSAPLAGKIGVVDTSKDELIGSVDIGGYIADIVDDGKGKLYVADATSNRILIVDMEKRSIIGEAKTSSPPLSLVVHRGRLFVNLGRELSIYEVPKLNQLKNIQFPSDIAYLVRFDPWELEGWWPYYPDERIAPIMMEHPRVIVQFTPLIFEPGSLSSKGMAGKTEPLPARKRRAEWKEGNVVKTIVANNDHTLSIGNKVLDVSAITDYQLLPKSLPLSKKDIPGTISFRIDNGESYDWMRGIWITPDQGLLLVNGTEEFWQWNGVLFNLSPGRHILYIEPHSLSAMIDGVVVSNALEGKLELVLEPKPAKSHWVFYYNEVPRVVLRAKNLANSSLQFRCKLELKNYMGEVVWNGEIAGKVMPGKVWEKEFAYKLKDMGRYELSVRAYSSEGMELRSVRFLVLPKLEHPRMLFRRDDIPEIKKRIEKFQPLYDKFFTWLKSECVREDFLPKSFSASTAVPGGRCWRRYDLGWNMLSLAFGTIFAPTQEDREFFRTRLEPLLKLRDFSWYCTFHHHGPFFPGAETIVFDISAMYSEEARKTIREEFAKRMGDMDMFPWTLVSIEEPLTSQKRALLFKILMWSVNWDRYFTLHFGKRGGSWWLNPRTWCHCPFAGYVISSLYLRNFFGEKRLFSKPYYQGFLTFHECIRPYKDNKNFLAPYYGPRPAHKMGEWAGEAGIGWGREGRWVLAALTNHPLLKSLCSDLDLQKLALAVALGYEPDAPGVNIEELPPTLLFEPEGWVVARSNWSSNLTELNFICGIRDHVYLDRPTTFRIAKSGEFLIGTAALGGDDGHPGRPSNGNAWGNVVVIGDSWMESWWKNQWPQRETEYAIVDRFSTSAYEYISRDRRLFGYSPAEGGYGGGLDFHGHTSSPFIREGEILAYETTPEFDYVAGDATNGWLPSEAEEVYRQIVFIKPNVVVIYDRVVLASPEKEAKWLSATGPVLELEHKRFRVENSGVSLYADVLLPEQPIFRTFSAKEYHDLFQGGALEQRVLEITNGEKGQKKVEFLIAMVVGEGVVEPLSARITRIDEEEVVVMFSYKGKEYSVAFKREGFPGGWISLPSSPLKHIFVDYVYDSYRQWRSYPRYNRWIKDVRLKFLNLH